jgi:hypothetical protein
MQMRSQFSALLISMGAISLGFGSANAAINYSISPVTVSAQPGDIGDSFDVLLSNSGPTAVTVAGFAFEVSVADTDISLTGANYSTVVAPYIFAGDSFVQEFAPPLNFTNSDGGSPQILDAADAAADGVGTTIAPGASTDLGQVTFDVSHSAQTGQFAVTFSGEVSGIADANNLSTPGIDSMTINVDSFSGGTISVSSVPEPSSLMMMLCAIPVMVLVMRRGRSERVSSR